MNGLTIELSPEQRDYIEGAVAAGRSASPSEFVLNLIDDALVREEHERIEQLLLEAENEVEEPVTLNPEFWAKSRAGIGRATSSEPQP
jgi:Arc/MetJ-type ribon-helix-helix transcriptional regulator